MTTKGLKLTRHESPGSVCHHSGTSKDDCPHKCGTYCGYCQVNPRPTPCNLAWVGCPNTDEIYLVLAPRLRETWPAVRLNHCELRIEAEIPVATKVTDHMRRIPKHET